MATAGKKTANDTEAAKRDLALQRKKLWNQDPNSWVDFLKGHNVDQVNAQGYTVKVCCPYHADSHPSGNINLLQGFYKCYAGSCEKYVSDPIQFIQQITQTGYSEAFELFRKHFQLTHKIKRETIQVFDDAEVL